MRRLVCVLCLVSAAGVCVGNAPQVQSIEIRSDPLQPNAVISTQHMALVHGIEQSDKVEKQQASLLLSPVQGGPQAVIKFRDNESWIEVISNSAAILMDTTKIPDPNFPFDPIVAPGPITVNEQNPAVSFMAPWWVIIKDNLEIGADGTRFYMYTTKDASGVNRVVVLLVEGGPVKLCLFDRDPTITVPPTDNNRKNVLELTSVGQYYDVVWRNANDTNNPRRVTVTSVNGVVPDDETAPSEIKPGSWPDFDRTIAENQQIVDTGKLLEDRRRELRNAPSIRSNTP